jgi:hypothetical protein
LAITERSSEQIEGWHKVDVEHVHHQLDRVAAALTAAAVPYSLGDVDSEAVISTADGTGPAHLLAGSAELVPAAREDVGDRDGAGRSNNMVGNEHWSGLLHFSRLLVIEDLAVAAAAEVLEEDQASSKSMSPSDFDRGFDPHFRGCR